MLPMEAQALEAMALYQGTVQKTEDGVEFETGGFVATEFETAAVEDTDDRDSTGVVNAFELDNEAALEEAWQQELANRTRDTPHILRFEEYREDYNGFNKVELTYYAGDNTLVDEREDMLDIDETIGAHNLSRFGQWTDEMHVLYVRNHVSQTDYEITRSEGRFGVLSGFTGVQ
jgi:hypothetical protein